MLFKIVFGCGDIVLGWVFFGVGIGFLVCLLGGKFVDWIGGVWIIVVSFVMLVVGVVVVLWLV